MDIELEANERIDDLEFKNLKIIQNKDGFCFGIDSVLLSDFAKNIKQNSKVIDLGTGTGIIPILLSKKTKSCNFIGCEIQKEVALMAERSVKINNLENQITIINDDVKNIGSYFKKESFSIMMCNPPYFEYNGKMVNDVPEKMIAADVEIRVMANYLTLGWAVVFSLSTARALLLERRSEMKKSHKDARAAA